MADEAASATQGSKAQLKQQKRAQRSLAFLERIERVEVTGITFRDDHETLQFRVVIKSSDEHAATLSARAARKNAKSVQPIVTYDSNKALSTLRGVHTAVHQWSSKHPGATAPDDLSACPYCKQFGSSAALQLWKWDDEQAEPPASKPGLTVVVGSSARADRRLHKIEKCINEYLESARRTDLVSDERMQSECQGYAHIPTLIATFLQNEDFASTPVTIVLSACLVM